MESQNCQLPIAEFAAFNFGFEEQSTGSQPPQIQNPGWSNNANGNVNAPYLGQAAWQTHGLSEFTHASPSPPRTSSSNHLAPGVVGHVEDASMAYQPRYDYSQTLDCVDQPYFDKKEVGGGFNSGVDGFDFQLGTTSWATPTPTAATSGQGSAPSYEAADIQPSIPSYTHEFPITPYQQQYQLMDRSPVSQQQYNYSSAEPSPAPYRPRTPMNNYYKPLLTRTSNTTFAPPLPSPPSSSSPARYIDNDYLSLNGNYYPNIPSASPMLQQQQHHRPHGHGQSPSPAHAHAHMLSIPKSRIRKSVSSAALPSRKVSIPKQAMPTPNLSAYYRLPRQVSSGQCLAPSTSQGNLRGGNGGSGAGATTRTMTKAKSMSNVRNTADSSRSTSRSRRTSRTLKGSGSKSNMGVSFVNFTPEDSQKLLSGVAPSGSSKTKARREQEAREKKKRLEEAA
ncbi:hypothetical protein KEM56_002509, partial [Ascosphaera pollenicola]